MEAQRSHDLRVICLAISRALWPMSGVRARSLPWMRGSGYTTRNNDGDLEGHWPAIRRLDSLVSRVNDTLALLVSGDDAVD